MCVYITQLTTLIFINSYNSSKMNDVLPCKDQSIFIVDLSIPVHRLGLDAMVVGLLTG
jgi:hypothetical protein